MRRQTTRGGWIGAVVGLHGWLIGACAVCGATGHWRLLGEILLVGLPLSVAFSAVFVISIETVGERLGTGADHLRAVLGCAAMFAGVLILLFNHWLAPRIEAEQRLRETLDEMHAMYRMNDWVPIGLLAISAILLSLTARALVRAGTRS